MQNELETYLAHIRNNYVEWMGEKVNEPHVQKMITEFNDTLRIQNGNKFIKVVRGGSVHSFIVKEDDNKFKKGDILMAASWKAPAKNFARGNIIEGNLSRIQWTGAL